VVIEQNIYADARPAAIRKRLCEFMSDSAVFVEILRHRYGRFRVLNLAQYDGESFITIEQNFDVIAGEDGCVGVSFNGGKKGRLVQPDLGNVVYLKDRGATPKENDRKQPAQTPYGFGHHSFLVRIAGWELFDRFRAADASARNVTTLQRQSHATLLSKGWGKEKMCYYRQIRNYREIS